MNRFYACFSLLFFLFFSELSHAKEEVEATNLAATEGLPNSIVNGSVCVITGEFIDQDTDLPSRSRTPDL